MSDDLRVLLRPAAAYRELALLETNSPWKRPLFFAFLFGCAISLLASGRVTLRLVIPGMLYASLIPLVEIAVLWALLRRGPGVSLGRAVDLFFMGHAVWCLWVLTLAAIFAFADPIRAFAITGTRWTWLTIVVAVTWSGYIDYCFFRCVSPDRAGRNLLAHRVLCWSAFLVVLGGGSLWTGLLGMLGK